MAESERKMFLKFGIYLINTFPFALCVSKPLGLKLEQIRRFRLLYLGGEKKPFHLHISASLSFQQTKVPEGKELSTLICL